MDVQIYGPQANYPVSGPVPNTGVMTIPNTSVTTIPNTGVMTIPNTDVLRAQNTSVSFPQPNPIDLPTTHLDQFYSVANQSEGYQAEARRIPLPLNVENFERLKTKISEIDTAIPRSLEIITPKLIINYYEHYYGDVTTDYLEPNALTLSIPDAIDVSSRSIDLSKNTSLDFIAFDEGMSFLLNNGTSPENIVIAETMSKEESGHPVLLSLNHNSRQNLQLIQSSSNQPIEFSIHIPLGLSSLQIGNIISDISTNTETLQIFSPNMVTETSLNVQTQMTELGYLGNFGSSSKLPTKSNIKSIFSSRTGKEIRDMLENPAEHLVQSLIPHTGEFTDGSFFLVIHGSIVSFDLIDFDCSGIERLSFISRYGFELDLGDRNGIETSELPVNVVLYPENKRVVGNTCRMPLVLFKPEIQNVNDETFGLHFIDNTGNMKVILNNYDLVQIFGERGVPLHVILNLVRIISGDSATINLDIAARSDVSTDNRNTDLNSFKLGDSASDIPTHFVYKSKTQNIEEIISVKANEASDRFCRLDDTSVGDGIKCAEFVDTLADKVALLSSKSTLEIVEPYTTSVLESVAPMEVDVALSDELDSLISGEKTVEGLPVEKAQNALDLLDLKLSLAAGIRSEDVPKILPPKKDEKNLNDDPLVKDLLDNFRKLIPKTVAQSISNEFIVNTLFDVVRILPESVQPILNLQERIDEKKKDLASKNPDVRKEAQLAITEWQDVLTKWKKEKAEIDSSINELRRVVDKVPLLKGVRHIKVLPFVHGIEQNPENQVIADCGNLRYVGFLGEPGAYTAFNVVGFQQQFDNIPGASTLPTTKSRYCLVPDIQGQLQSHKKDNLFGGINVEITYENGQTEIKNIASNQQLIKIFERKTDGDNTDVFSIAALIPMVEIILRMNGLDPALSSVSFMACRGLGEALRENPYVGYNFKALSMNVDVCQVIFNPQQPHEFIPKEAPRLILSPTQNLGQVVIQAKPSIFDPANPNNLAKQKVLINFGDPMNEPRSDKNHDYFVCLRGEENQIHVPYSLLVEFDNFLKKNPQYLFMFNKLSPFHRKQVFTQILLNPEIADVGLSESLIDRIMALGGNECEQASDEEQCILQKANIAFRERGEKGDCKDMKCFLQQHDKIHFERHAWEELFPKIFYEYFNKPANGKFLIDQLGDKDPRYKRPDMPMLLRQLIKELHDKEFPRRKFLGLFGGSNTYFNTHNIHGGNPIEKSYFDELMQKSKSFYIFIQSFNFDDINLDENMILDINNLNISNILKVIIIQIQKIKLQIINRKYNTPEYFKFIYSYFYEIIYRELLSMINDYKLEIETINSSILKGNEYYTLFNNICIKHNILEFKSFKKPDSILDSIKQELIKDYNNLVDKVFGIQPIKTNNIVTILKETQYLADTLPEANTLIEKYIDLYNIIIIERWATYMMIYNISPSICNLKLEIDKIEYDLILQKTINNNNILEPLTGFIPNYQSLLEKYQDFYTAETLKLITTQQYDKFIDCDFLSIYYKQINNKIENIYRNIVEIRKINMDIIDFFIVKNIPLLNNPLGLKVKYNIYVYSEQLNYYLNNVDEIFDIYTNDIPIENEIKVFKIQEILLIKENIKLWLAQTTPKTIENKLIVMKNSMNEIYDHIKVNELIYSMIV